MPEIVRCARCRHFLMPSSVLVGSHGLDVSDERNCSNGQQLSALFVRDEQCPQFIMEQIIETRWTKGKLKCLKCKTTVGSHNFVQPFCCSCGEAQLPSIALHSKKVDVLPEMEIVVQTKDGRRTVTCQSDQHNTKTNHLLAIKNMLKSKHQEHITNTAKANHPATENDTLGSRQNTTDIQKPKVLRALQLFTSKRCKASSMTEQSHPTGSSHVPNKTTSLNCRQHLPTNQGNSDSAAPPVSDIEESNTFTSVPSTSPSRDSLLRFTFNTSPDQPTDSDQETPKRFSSPLAAMMAKRKGARSKFCRHNPSQTTHQNLKRLNSSEHGLNNENETLLEASKHLERESLLDFAAVKVSETSQQRSENAATLDRNKWRDTGDKPQCSLLSKRLDLWDTYLVQKSKKLGAEASQSRTLQFDSTPDLTDAKKKRSCQDRNGKKVQRCKHAEASARTSHAESDSLLTIRELAKKNFYEIPDKPIFKNKYICNCGRAKCQARMAQWLGEELGRVLTASQTSVGGTSSGDIGDTEKEKTTQTPENTQIDKDRPVSNASAKVDNPHPNGNIDSTQMSTACHRPTENNPKTIKGFRVRLQIEPDVRISFPGKRRYEPVSFSPAQLELVRDEARTASDLIFREAFSRRRHSCSSCSRGECHMDPDARSQTGSELTCRHGRQRRQSEPPTYHHHDAQGAAARIDQAVQPVEEPQVNELGHVVVRHMREFQFRDRGREEAMQDALERLPIQAMPRKSCRHRSNRSTSASTNKSSFKCEKKDRFKVTPEDVGDEGLCAVCYEIMYKPHTVIPCKHIFCVACLWGIARHMQPNNVRCPMCRTSIRKCILNEDLLRQLKTKYSMSYMMRERFVKRHMLNQSNVLPYSRPPHNPAVRAPPGAGARFGGIHLRGHGRQVPVQMWTIISMKGLVFLVFVLYLMVQFFFR